MVPSVPSMDCCRPVVPQRIMATGVLAGMPCFSIAAVHSLTSRMPMSTTLVPGIFAICS